MVCRQVLADFGVFFVFMLRLVLENSRAWPGVRFIVAGCSLYPFGASGTSA